MTTTHPIVILFGIVFYYVAGFFGALLINLAVKRKIRFIEGLGLLALTAGFGLTAGVFLKDIAIGVGFGTFMVQTTFPYQVFGAGVLVFLCLPHRRKKKRRN